MIQDRTDDRNDQGGEQPGRQPRGLAMDVEYYRDLARRRWWVFALALVFALSGFMLLESRRLDFYTADVLLKKEAERSPLEALSSPLGGRGPSAEAIATQMETLRSRSVLGRVVDSLALRLILDGGVTPRSDLVAEAHVAPDAPPGAFEVRWSDGRAALVDRGGRALAHAGPGEWLRGPGFGILLAPGARTDQAVAVELIPRQHAVRALARQVRIEPVRATSLIRVSYSSTDPVLSRDVVNAVASSYQVYAASRGREEAAMRRQFIAEQLAAVADSVRAAHAVLSEYQEQSRTLDPRIEGDALARAIMDAETELEKLRFQERVLSNLANAVASPDDTGLSRILAVNPELLPGGASLYDRLQQLESERRRMTLSQGGVRAGGPGTVSLDAQIVDVKTDIRDVAREASVLYSAQRMAAEARISELRQRAGGLPARATAFTRLQQRVQAAQSSLDMLSESYYAAQIAEAVEMGDVEVIDPAEAPLAPDPRGTRRNLILALMFGSLLGLVGAVVVDRLDHSVRDPRDAQIATGLETLALIPHLGEVRDRPAALVVEDGGHGPGLEAFRQLRTMLHFIRLKQPQVVAVTSAGPGEGKSTVAANLALALAQKGGAVLLLDTDLRRPVQHQMFGLDRAPGLADVLVGDISVHAAVRNARGSLDVLTCGTKAPNPTELLAGTAFADLLADVRERYDAIVIDTPPILAVTDAGVVAHVADGLMVVARAGVTDRFALSWGVEQLRKMRAPLLGLVLNGMGHGTVYGRYGGDYGSSYHAPDGEDTSLNGRGGRLAALQRRIFVKR
jgi:polysaccharide biosynthesis transport protein